MPFVLIITGVILLVAGTRNTQGQLYSLVQGDFVGTNNFVYWFLSILVIGAIGYVPKLKPISEGFLILVILVLFLSRGTGFFDMFNKQVGSTQTASKLPTTQPGTGTYGPYPGIVPPSVIPYDPTITVIP